ncbi:hypothetical protein [Aeromonas phage JELG-KS1]|uniref:Uncharacterized protein n=1 Tax=Aeromonas phage JELG-KS1 TaxID=2951233 RepID=A0A9E7NKS5_9CAUD|nr:hypothetical protein [Aeromonas phage JELG-KS1]
MCFMKAPSISTAVPTTPDPLADPAGAPKVESVDFGGSSESDTETASGIKGEKAKGKSSLKINKPKANAKIGANYSTGPRPQV